MLGSPACWNVCDSAMLRLPVGLLSVSPSDAFRATVIFSSPRPLDAYKILGWMAEFIKDTKAPSGVCLGREEGAREVVARGEFGMGGWADAPRLARGSVPG